LATGWSSSSPTAAASSTPQIHMASQDILRITSLKLLGYGNSRVASCAGWLDRDRLRELESTCTPSAEDHDCVYIYFISQIMIEGLNLIKCMCVWCKFLVSKRQAMLAWQPPGMERSRPRVCTYTAARPQFSNQLSRSVHRRMSHGIWCQTEAHCC